MIDEQTIAEIVRRVLERLDLLPEATSAPAAQNAAGPVRRQFVTAEEVARRAATGCPVALVANEWLTPQARDYVRENGLHVDAPPVPCEFSVPPPAPPKPKPLGMVLWEPTAETPSILTSVARSGVAVRRFAENNCWMQDGMAMMKRVAGGELLGGVFLVPTGAATAVFANKFRGVRAVLGCDVDTVAEAVAQFDANVLIVEHARRSFHEARNLIRAFATLPRCGGGDSVLLAAIAKLEGSA